MINNLNTNKLINTFIESKIGNYRLENNNSIKFRYEYLHNNKDKNIFIYLKNWNQLINLYKIIPEKNRHFYEIIDEKCKFFLDLDAKCCNIDDKEWNDNINFIKQELIKFFNKVFNKNVRILEYQSFPTQKERKYSCHLIIPNYCFYADDCKNIINMFINTINIKHKNIIDDKVYGKRRMLRIEGSTNLNSDRKKVYINKYENNYYLIKLEELITNLENTELLITNLYNPIIDRIIKDNYQEKKIVFKQSIEKHKYTENDVIFIKNNYEKIINIIHEWHYDNIKAKNLNNIFIFNYILNNMIILKRIKSFLCPYCERIHETQNPYVFSFNNNIYYHCRRSSKPVKICKL